MFLISLFLSRLSLSLNVLRTKFNIPDFTRDVLGRAYCTHETEEENTSRILVGKPEGG